MDTFPKLLLKNADTIGDSPSIRAKRLGIWKELSWAQTRDEVAAVSYAFDKMGIARNDKVAVLSPNQPEMIIAITAIQALGAIPVIIYPYLAGETLASILHSTNCKYAFTYDQQEVDALLDLGDQQSLSKIIHVYSRGMASYDKRTLVAFNDLKGQSDMSQALDFLRAKVNETQSDDTAFVFLSSGISSGEMKAAPISHKNILTATQSIAKLTNANSADNVLLANSLALLPNMIFGYTLPHYTGLCANCPESSETVLENMREISPSILFAPPHVYKYISGLIHNRISMSEGFSRKLYRQYVEEKSGLLRSWLGEILICAPIKDLYGMSHVRHAISSGSMISEEVNTFFKTLGVSIQQMYGSVETSGCATLQDIQQDNPMNVGMPIEGCEVKIENGDILCRGNNVASTDLQDGWFRTGDVGSLNDQGELILAGRRDARGKVKKQEYAADVIESNLKSSMYIKDAVVFGNNQRFLSALLVVEEDITANWADRNGLRYAGYESLVSKEEIANLIRLEIARNTGSTDHSDTSGQPDISKFILIPRDFSMDAQEVTYTTKINRIVIARNFAPVIDAVYKNKNSAVYSDPSLKTDKEVEIHSV